MPNYSSDFTITTLSSSVAQYGASSQAPFRVGPFGPVGMRNTCRPYYSSQNQNLYRVEDCLGGVTPYVDQWAQFDGIPAHDWVTYTGNAGLYPSTQYTISTWVWQDSHDPGTYFEHRDQVGSSNANSAYIRIELIGGGRLKFTHHNSPSSFSVRTTSDKPLEVNGQWYNCVFTFDAGTIKIYVNGVEKTHGGSAIATSARNVTGSVISTINANPSFASVVGGRYKEFSYWTGVVATSAQVLEIYNSGTPPDLTSLSSLASPIFWSQMRGTWDLSIGAGVPAVSGSPSFGP